MVDVEIGGDPRGGVRLEHLEAHELDDADQGQAASEEAAKIKIVRTKILSFLATNVDGFAGNRSDLRTASDGGQNAIFSKALRQLEEGGHVDVAKGCIRRVPEVGAVVMNGAAANDADHIHDLYDQV